MKIKITLVQVRIPSRGCNNGEGYVDDWLKAEKIAGVLGLEMHPLNEAPEEGYHHFDLIKSDKDYVWLTDQEYLELLVVDKNTQVEDTCVKWVDTRAAAELRHYVEPETIIGG